MGATADAPKIKVRGVERRFGLAGGDPVHALGPIDLEIGDGEFVCIVGPSGCGKSTLLRVIAGLVPPTAGEVEIAVAGDPRRATSMVFQSYGIYPWKTVERNVTFGLEVAGVPLKQARERAAHWLERLRLADFARAWPDTLSGGMRQRVAIARALVMEPEILLMDEPFAALDAQLRQILQEELLALWEAERRTVVFVTHSLEEAAILGDRVDVMTARPGRLLKSVEVPFERPRHGEIRARKEFNEFRNDLWEHLRGEVEAEYAEDRPPTPTATPTPASTRTPGPTPNGEPASERSKRPKDVKRDVVSATEVPESPAAAPNGEPASERSKPPKDVRETP